MSTAITGPLRSEVDVVHRVLGHIDAGTTDEGEAWREPVAHYVDPGRFADELRLLRSSPSAFVPSAAIATPGDHIDRVVYGVPLFAVRDRDGRARVFRNACRHRGVALVEGRGCARALVCRYHGWTYRLDGALAHVPHDGGFPDLDRSAHGLVDLPCREVDGLIVIGGVGPAGGVAPLDAGLADLADGSAWRDKLLSASHVVDVSSQERPMNWKVLVEQFLEGYHIRSTHRDTFFPLQYDNLNVVETFGPNCRVTYPYRNIERLRDRPPSTWSVAARLTFVYHLFPNVVLASFPDRLLMIVIDPIDVGRSTLTTYTLAPAAAAEAGARASAAGAAGPGGQSSLLARGGLEDDAMSSSVQQGLHSGANEYVTFGRHESAIGHFHRTLDDRLARSQSQPVQLPGRRGVAVAG